MSLERAVDSLASSSFPCPICGSHTARKSLCPVVLVGSDPVYQLLECAECLTRFLWPMPSGEDLARFYGPHYYGSDWFKQEPRGRMFGRFMLPRGAAGKFLDVGCSLGYFIEGVRRSSGWQTYGVEISPEAAGFARDRLGLDVRCGELPAVGYPGNFFDYVHVNNVLEHARDPAGFLKECRRILRRDGWLYLSVPNGPVDSALLLKYYRSEGAPARSKDGHIFFFSQRALGQLFRASRFEVVSTRTISLRRGLRALGYYPRKRGWKQPFRPHNAAPVQSHIQLPPRKRRLPGYYAYRFWQARLKMLPGLRSIGLDFEIILRAV